MADEMMLCPVISIRFQSMSACIVAVRVCANVGLGKHNDADVKPYVEACASQISGGSYSRYKAPLAAMSSHRCFRSQNRELLYSTRLSLQTKLLGRS